MCGFMDPSDIACKIITPIIIFLGLGFYMGMEFIGHDYFSLFLEIIWIYLLVCIIAFLYDIIRKRIKRRR